MNSIALLHIPHASLYIPNNELSAFLLPENELRQIRYQMTDWYTDELYPVNKFEAVVSGVSRLVVDVERFLDDCLEPMAKVGQGVVYTHAPDGQKLRNVDDSYRSYLLRQYYLNHHELFYAAAHRKLSMYDRCLIVDCHSYSAADMPGVQKPEICIGADAFHTPKELVEFAMAYIKEAGFTVDVNVPFSGTIVPSEYYRNESRLYSIMLELDRGLYLESEPYIFRFRDYVDYSGKKNKSFGQIAGFLEKLVCDLEAFCKKI